MSRRNKIVIAFVTTVVVVTLAASAIALPRIQHHKRIAAVRQVAQGLGEIVTMKRKEGAHRQWYYAYVVLAPPCRVDEDQLRQAFQSMVPRPHSLSHEVAGCRALIDVRF